MWFCPSMTRVTPSRHLQWLACCDETAGAGGLLMHSATLSGLSVAATTTTTSLGSTFPSFVALNVTLSYRGGDGVPQPQSTRAHAMRNLLTGLSIRAKP